MKLILSTFLLLFACAGLFADEASEQKLAEFLHSGFATYDPAEAHLVIGSPEEVGSTCRGPTFKITVKCEVAFAYHQTGVYVARGMHTIDNQVFKFYLELDNHEAILRAVELSKAL